MPEAWLELCLVGSCGTSSKGQLALWVPLRRNWNVPSQGQFNRNISQPLTLMFGQPPKKWVDKHQEVRTSASGWDGPVRAAAVQS